MTTLSSMLPAFERFFLKLEYQNELSLFRDGNPTIYFPVNLENKLILHRFPNQIEATPILGIIPPRDIVNALFEMRRPQNTNAEGAFVLKRVHDMDLPESLVMQHDRVHRLALATIPNKILSAQKELIRSLLGLNHGELSKEIWHLSDMASYHFGWLTRAQCKRLESNSQLLTQVFCLSLFSIDDSVSWARFFVRDDYPSVVMWQLVLDIFTNAEKWKEFGIESKYLIGPFNLDYQFLQEHAKWVLSFEEKEKQIFALSFLYDVSKEKPDAVELAKNWLSGLHGKDASIEKYFKLEPGCNEIDKNKLIVLLDNEPPRVIAARCLDDLSRQHGSSNHKPQ